MSVLVPVYNGEKYLAECISSVLRQSCEDFELLIGDNCSADGTREIVGGFSDRRIRYFLRDRNLGLFPNLNDLVRKARAPLLRILCHDDLLEPNCLEEEILFSAEHPETGMFFCKTLKIDEIGNEIGRCVLGDLAETVPPVICLQHFFYYGCLPGNLSTVCVRRDSMDEVGLFDESYRVAGDYELWTRICAQRNLGVIHKHLVCLRSHDGRLSCSPESGVLFIEECKRVRARLLSLLPETVQPYARYYDVARFCVSDVHHAMRCLWEGRVRDFSAVARTVGLWGKFPLGFLCWLFTVNNRLFRPAPKYAA